jgi:HSP20 family protein
MYHTHETRGQRGNWHGCGQWKKAAFTHRMNQAGWGASEARSVNVNIREQADYYELFVFAPGRTKDAFHIAITDDVLVIKANAGTPEPAEQWLHFEHNPKAGFERRFQLNKKVDTDAITARYVDGVLEITLPKLPGSAPQKVDIA